MATPEHAILTSQLAEVRQALAASLAENQQIRYEQNELLRLLGDQTLNRHLNTQHVAALQRLDESHARKLSHSLQVRNACTNFFQRRMFGRDGQYLCV